jgi:signal transduction histidine kinase/CheY-like chemotaxis protein/HPt (histidine-containing phosphotransfer) domain-containing protein
MLRHLGRIFFAQTLPFRGKLFNILVIGALFISLFVCISGFVTGASFANSLVCGITAVLAVLLLLVGTRTGRYQLSFFVSIVVVFFIFYPIMFFSAGGYRSGMPSFFVFAVVFTVFMLEGRKALVVSLAEIAYYTVLCIYAYYHPEFVSPFGSEFAYVADVLVGVISVSAVLGMTLFIQLGLYNSQQKELKEAYQDLEEQTRLAESVSRAKTDFLAQMSHEIRTPMNAIIGMSHLTLQEEISPQAREYLGNIWRAGDNLMSIINDILDFSRIESGRLNIAPGEYQLASLINDTLSIIRTRLHEKPVLMFTMIDSTLPRQLFGDEARIRQILLNLLSNAVKYTREGHVILSIRGEKSADNRGIVLWFEVADTGIGIKQEDMGKLFGNFVRIDAKQNRGIEGTGLGLAISRRLCQLMGGDITVRSVYGKGSTFTASLPQTIADSRPFAQVEAPDSKPVLIYEKRRVSGESLVYTVKNLGVSCSRADSREALAGLLENGNYRFVFMPSALYTEFRDTVEKQKTLSGESSLLSLNGIIPVIFAEYGEAIRTDVKTLMMPIHPAAVADILNGKASDAGYNHVQKSGVRFTAPDARILVVDDMVTNLDVTAGLLVSYRVKVDRALEGPEAIRLIHENRYDIVFMDHMMPGMDGIEATEIIRKTEGDYFKNLPIIALTANAIFGMKEMFLEKGFNDYLSKPIEIFRLDDVLGKWIPAEKKIKEESWKKPDTAKPGRAGLGISGKAGAPLFPAIDGLDTARGLANTGGTEDGYRHVLSSFVQDTEDRLGQISGLPRADGLTVFTVHVHALKGAAGSIGAAELSADAARLEAAGRSGDMETIRKLLPPFCERLSVLAGKIRETLEKGGGQGADGLREGEMRDDPALGEKAGPLREALESINMTEIDRLITEMEKLAGNPQTRRIIARLSHHVLVGEYDEAVETLGELLKPPE